MTEVVSVKFRNRGKAYFFAPGELKLRTGEQVIVETSKGLEIGTVLYGNHQVEDSQVVAPLRSVVRVATAEDERVAEQCRQRERDAYVIGRQKIEAHGLDMKLVDVECSFEGNKIIFFFSSEGRVDFRELVKDLAGVFRTRIELRQIGVRDEARMLGGLGICGRPFCCGTFMEEFKPVSTKMAKVQALSLNPAKISGSCGRLMCCLRYEQPAYEELIKGVPKMGAFVETPDGYGNVNQVNILRQTVRVKMDGEGDDAFRLYSTDEVAAVPGGRPRDGSQPPHVLVLKPKKLQEPEEDLWERPERLIAGSEEEQESDEGQERLRRVHVEEVTSAEGRKSRRSGRHRKGSGKAEQPGKTDKPNAERPSQEKQGHAGKHRQKSPRPQTDAPAAQEQTQKSHSKNHHNRRRPHNRRPKSEGGKQEG